MSEAAENNRAPVVTRPPHYPTPYTRDTVRHLVAYGLDDEQISVILRCLPSEIRYHYADELKHGLARINAQVQSVVLNNALIERDTQAAKLWLINKAGWRSGDGPRIGLAFNQPPAEGEFTVTERRVVMERVLSHASNIKRTQPVIQGEASEVKNGGGVRTTQLRDAAPRSEGATRDPEGVGNRDSEDREATAARKQKLRERFGVESPAKKTNGQNGTNGNGTKHR
jgi:hypothetical protein